MLVNTELVAAIFTLFVLVRVAPYVSLPHLLLRKVKFWLPPTEEDVEALMPKEHRRMKDATRDAHRQRMAVLPKTVEELLDRRARFVQFGMLNRLTQYEHLDMLCFLVASSFIVFFFSEIMSCIRATAPQDVSFYAILTTLLSCFWFIASPHLSFGYSAAETKLALGTGLLGIMVSYGLLSLPASVYDFSFREGLDLLANRTDVLLTELGVPLRENAPAPDGMTILRVCLSLFGGIVGLLTLLPAFRFARCYNELIVRHPASRVVQAICQVNFFLPFIVSATFVKPVFANFFMRSDLIKCSPEAVFRDCTAANIGDAFFVKESTWWTFRVWLLIICAALRLVIVPQFTQAYLNISREEAVKLVVSQVTATENADSADRAAFLRVKIVQTCERIYQYICVATLQMIAPAILLVCYAFLLHRKGLVDFGLCSAAHGLCSSIGISLNALAASGTTPSSLELALQTGVNMLFGRNVSLASFQVVPPELVRALVAFAVWWTTVVWFVMAAVSSIYWNLHHASVILEQREAEEAAGKATAEQSKKRK